MPLAAADLIVTGATIHTVDEACASSQAFAVRGDRFVQVGSLEDAMALRGTVTEVLDLRGYTVLPGIVDAHLHLTNLGLKLEQINLDGIRSPLELVERSVAFAKTSGDPWIVGRGWDENLWPERVLPSNGPLSEALPDRPVALARVDGHALLANARAMTIAGIGHSTPDPPGGRILRDERGAPTGMFIDTAATPIYEKVPKPTHEQLVRATRAGIAECNRWGITAVAEPGVDDDVLAAHADLLGNGEYSIRNYAMLHDAPALIESHVRAGIVDGAFNGRLWVRAIKMYADGALGSRGAALLAPYSDDPENVGLILTSQERIESVTKSALQNGFQVCVHAIGDRANRMVLDAYEAALGRVRAASDPRLRIEHAQVIAPEDLPRFAKLGVIASIQTPHAVSDARWAHARLGPDRLARAYPWQSLLDAGASIANGTDAPVESASAPRTFHAAVAGGCAGQCMMRREALASMTIWPARANFQEALIGSITPRKFADFVVMDRDWIAAPPEEIERTRIVATYFSGRRVYGDAICSRSRRPVDSGLR